MTDEPNDVTSEAEFQRRLSDLVSNATANGVGVEGGWTVEAGAADETLDVVITRVESAHDVE